MKIEQKIEPDIQKPLIIAAMQDMGDVGSIVIDFINKSLDTYPFREIASSLPGYVIDNGGFIELPEETWGYRYTKDTIVFGGGAGRASRRLCPVRGLARHAGQGAGGDDRRPRV